MTAPADVPIALARATEVRPTRWLGSARRLFLHGLAVIAAAVLLGIAEAVSLWIGALLVGVGLLLVAGSLTLIGLVGHLVDVSRRT